MTASDEYGHTYMRRNAINEYRDPPKDWIIHYWFSENDGWTFQNRGAERRIRIEIAPNVKWKTVRTMIDIYKGLDVSSLEYTDLSVQAKIYCCLEDMLTKKERESVFSG
jgi:hypothetical protein